jgi:hypothetical protein
MAQNIVESIFNSKQNLNDFYPQFPGVKTFDLHKKHLLYGRIDKDGDAVYLDDSNLKQLDGGESGTHLAVDFVCSAFSDMKKNIRSAASKGFVSKESLYPTRLQAFKSWANGDLEYSYDQYLNKMYTTFVDSYLTIDRRADKIKNYKDFVKEFLKFALRTAKYFPVTKTGFISSIHCSPYISGLMLEISNETHGLETNARVVEFIKDRNFSFFVNEVKKFGFMVDKNAPWRLVFNVASGLQQKRNNGSLAGGQMYMDKFAVNYENIFKTYYRKAYLDEHLSLKLKMYSLYKAFYLQFSTYESIGYMADSSGRCNNMKIIHERKERELPPSDIGSGDENDEYWLKILLKLRLAETSSHRHGSVQRGHDLQDAHTFNFHANEAVKLIRIFELRAGLKYINELTKGFPVTNFLSKGDYWYGITNEEYQQRKAEIARIALEPSIVDYSITGTKNIK